MMESDPILWLLCLAVSLLMALTGVIAQSALHAAGVL
jgi:hypothetical protein